MNKSVNKIELRGYVGRDPQINEIADAKVVRFSIATNETFKDKTGKLKEETTWHNIVAWNGKGMLDFQKIKKGSFIGVLGRVRESRYQTEAGEEKFYHDVLANRITIEEG
ncbi:MAG: single-stranded DNA-binding protein [Bacteroidales bacterium]